MRCRFLLTCLLASCVLTLGDVSAPANATRVSINPSYNVSYSIIGDSSMVILVESNQSNYFGLGYRDTMRNCDMTIVQLANSTVTAKDYWSVGYSAPTIDKINNVVLLGWESDFRSFLKVKWARPLITNDPEDNSIEIGNNYVFCLAWGPSPVLSFHGGSVEVFGVATGQAASFLRSQPQRAAVNPRN